MEIGEKIKKYRIIRHLTLEQLGDRVGVGKSTVRKWEEGIIVNMKRDKIEKVANALGISSAYLMGWTDDPNYIVVDINEDFQNIDDYTQTFHKAISKHEEAAPPSMDAEMQMLTFLYGALSKENKMKIVETMQLMLLRQKGERDVD